jgi:hypothetical protein
LGFPRFSTPEKQRKHKQITHKHSKREKKERRYRPTDCCVQQDVR